MLDVQNQCQLVTNKIPDKYHSLNTTHCLTHQWHWCLNFIYWPGWWNVKFTVLKDVYVNTVCTKASDMYNVLSNKFFGKVERSILELLRDNPYINWKHIYYMPVHCYTRQSLALLFIECKHKSVVAQTYTTYITKYKCRWKYFSVYYIKYSPWWKSVINGSYILNVIYTL
jgi:hypothetical protein